MYFDPFAAAVLPFGLQMHSIVLLPTSVSVQRLETTNGDWASFVVFNVSFSIVSPMSSPVVTMLIVPLVELPDTVWFPSENVSSVLLALYLQPSPELSEPPVTGCPSTVRMSVENT